MQTNIVWEEHENPPERGTYTVLVDVGDYKPLQITTANWSPSSGLWFHECRCIKPDAWAKSIIYS